MESDKNVLYIFVYDSVGCEYPDVFVALKKVAVKWAMVKDEFRELMCYSWASIMPRSPSVQNSAFKSGMLPACVGSFFIV